MLNLPYEQFDFWTDFDTTGHIIRPTKVAAVIEKTASLENDHDHDIFLIKLAFVKRPQESSSGILLSEISNRQTLKKVYRRTGKKLLITRRRHENGKQTKTNTVWPEPI